MRNTTDTFVQNGSHTAEVEKPKSQSLHNQTFAQHIAYNIFMEHYSLHSYNDVSVYNM